MAKSRYQCYTGCIKAPEEGREETVKYHIDTIPVWDAMEKETPCPLCTLYEKCEADEIDRSLGGSVMEPDARIRVNQRGICERHHQHLFQMKNRLGHALLTDSHTREMLDNLEKMKKLIPTGRKSLFGGKSSADELADTLEKLSQSCVICEDIETHMQRYLYTFVHLWKTDAAFSEKWTHSQGVCLPHAARLLRMAQKQLNADQMTAFSQQLLDLVTQRLSQDEKDLEWFTLKFDYRNQDKPWGNSRNALERTINRLRGRCISSDSTD